MENIQELKQKSVESYFLEFSVPEDKKEKVLMGITNLVYKMNQRIIKYEKETDESVKVDLLKIIQENEATIKQVITNTLEGKEGTVNYDY